MSEKKVGGAEVSDSDRCARCGHSKYALCPSIVSTIHDVRSKHGREEMRFGERGGPLTHHRFVPAKEKGK